MHFCKMNFYLLFIVFLFVGGCNARVVPLDFKVDKMKRLDSSITENELIDESSTDDIKIIKVVGDDLPNAGQDEDLELLNSERDNTIAPEISSSLSADLTSEAEAMAEDLNLESIESLVISDVLEELSSTSELGSQSKRDSIDSLRTMQVNTTLNDETTEDVKLKNETSIKNISSLSDLEQRNNLDLVKIEEKELNDTFDQSENLEVSKSDKNEMFASFVVYSDQNETSAIFQVVNSTNATDSFELQPLSNDAKDEVFLNDVESITEKFAADNLTSKNELTNDSVEISGVILSGFEFLINTEVARNAAKAMEVFNFSDPLTDHIIEENEFHSFLPAYNTVLDLDSSNQTDLNTTTIITNSSLESDEILAELKTSLTSGDETLILLNQTQSEKTNDSSMFLSKPLEEKQQSESINLIEKFEGNVTSLTENSETEEFAKNATGTKTNVTASVTNTIVIGPSKCPPPGLCILWFLSQDACALNEHCLGNRICCQIGCSKTCIDVESL